jgi:hypothetical protein
MRENKLVDERTSHLHHDEIAGKLVAGRFACMFLVSFAYVMIPPTEAIKELRRGESPELGQTLKRVQFQASNGIVGTRVPHRYGFLAHVDDFFLPHATLSDGSADF